MASCTIQGSIVVFLSVSSLKHLDLSWSGSKLSWDITIGLEQVWSYCRPFIKRQNIINLRWSEVFSPSQWHVSLLTKFLLVEQLFLLLQVTETCHQNWLKMVWFYRFLFGDDPPAIQFFFSLFLQHNSETINFQPLNTKIF